MTSEQRKNVTTACKACRERKTKCNGALPRCAGCVRVDRWCQYEDKDDRRRLSLPPTIRILRARITTLTGQLRGAGIVPAPVKECDAAVADKVLASLSLASLTEDVVHETERPHPLDAYASPISAPLQDTTSADPSQSGATTSSSAPLDIDVGLDDFNINWNDSPASLDWLWAGAFAPELEASFASATTFDPQTARQQTVPVQASAPNATNSLDAPLDDEPESEFASQIAARFGSLHIVGTSLRYFGTTANAHLFAGGQSDGHYAKLRTMAKDGADLLRDANLDAQIDPIFEQRLVDFFFAWHNSCHYVVDRLVHDNARKQYNAGEDCRGLYSPVLMSAMCAIGASHVAKYHPSLVTFPRPLSEFFADRAKVLLEIELDSPCVSTVQALLLLSSHEAGFVRTARSWLYSGMAMRLCFDLGLHVNVDSYVEQGIMGAPEAHMRQVVFWASYVHNYRTSFTLGRPFTLDASEILVRKPTAAMRPSYSLWSIYPQGAIEEGAGMTEGTPDLVGIISEQRIVLSDLVEPIARALYGNTTISRASLQQLSERITNTMFKWYENLPALIRLSNEPSVDSVPQQGALPQVLVLHLEYHYFQILIHRPWTSRRLQPSPPQGPGFQHARQVCVDSACSMSRILSTFERLYGFRRLDIETSQMLPSACLILVFAGVSSLGSAGEVGQYLNTFLRALDELSNTHASARQQRDSLLFVQERWGTMHKQLQRTAADGDERRGKRARRDG